MGHTPPKTKQLLRINSGRHKSLDIFQNVYSFARAHRILVSLVLGLLLVIGIYTVYVTKKIANDNAHIRGASALVDATKLDMKKLGASEVSFQRYCSTHTSPEIDHTTTVTCFAELNAYFTNKNTAQMKTILSSEIHRIEKRGITISADRLLVDSYGFGYSGSDCTVTANFELPRSWAHDRLDSLSSVHQRGRVTISCATLLSFVTRLSGKY